MNLLVDAGNSRLKWAAVAGARWEHRGTVPVDAHLAGRLARAWASLRRPKRVIVASVAGDAVARTLAEAIRNRWSLEAQFVHAGVEQLGIRNRYTAPAELGSDRWAAMIGARRLAAGAFCVVDCGTAVTIEAVSAAGEFMGGAILPGLSMARRALAVGTAAVDVVEGEARLDGRSTGEAVAAGTLLGLAGGIERILAEYEDRLGVVTVFLTGGDAQRLKPHLHRDVRHEPDLVLFGLAAIAEPGP